MQSQQKRVKWSRGETAEALEERTDTGITQASVELMENCIPDIYGNISRRPALKPIPKVNNSAFKNYFSYDPYMQVIPFYITEDDYILIAIHGNNHVTESLRIKNGYAVARYDLTERITNAFHEDLVNGTETHHPLSFAQQNNYLLIASEARIYKLQISNYLTTDSYQLSINEWNFIAGWYATEGASTKKVDNTTQVTIPGGTVITLSALEFNQDGGGFVQHIETLSDGSSIAYSALNTNLANSEANMQAIEIAIAVGSIVQFPNNGAYMRVEGYYVDNSKIMIYGALLTPVAQDDGKDKAVVVEYGYTRLYPTQLDKYLGTYYPHPTQLQFLDQRLWAGDWLYGTGAESTGYYSLVVGSQIAKYNDFKNDYNQENEAITLDILTQYKEKIVHLVDYNGLKIMTDTYEYSYENGAVVKQSGNGSLRDCKPIVFESLCLYCDATGHQIKAMQYEFQSDIFNSTTVNSIAPHDLIWYPFCMAGYEDKIHSTGKYIFLANADEEGHPRIAVCNFVPGNQANIWSRWSLATTIDTSYIKNETITPAVVINNPDTPIVQSIVNLKDDVIFLTTLKLQNTAADDTASIVVPTKLDFDNETDLKGEIVVVNSGLSEEHYYSVGFGGAYLISSQDYVATISDAPVAIYYDNEFKFLTTTDAQGKIAADLSGFDDITKISVGLPINSIIRSHPIDVGGKTKSVMKRIGKTQISVHDTAAGAITINGKTGYMNPRIDHICFYGVTGMKDEIKYTITNNNGAMFHLESLLMNIEYGTLDS